MRLVTLLLMILLFVSCSSEQKDIKKVDPKTGKVTDQKKDGKKEKTVKEILEEDEEFIQVPLDPKDIVPPMKAIKNLDKMLEEYHLGQNLTPEQVKSNKKLKQKIIQGTFDIKELCRLSLGKHWHVLTKEQRKHFVDLMTKLLETKAIFSTDQLKGENKLYRITYKKEVYDNPGKERATVISKMRVPKEKVIMDITYKMLISPFGWKIFDVIVDDASLLTNYKFQFDRIIKKSGFEELIARMEKKLKEISK